MYLINNILNDPDVFVDNDPIFDKKPNNTFNFLNEYSKIHAINYSENVDFNGLSNKILPKHDFINMFILILTDTIRNTLLYGSRSPKKSIAFDKGILSVLTKTKTAKFEHEIQYNTTEETKEYDKHFDILINENNVTKLISIAFPIQSIIKNRDNYNAHVLDAFLPFLLPNLNNLNIDTTAGLLIMPTNTFNTKGKLITPENVLEYYSNKNINITIKNSFTHNINSIINGKHTNYTRYLIFYKPNQDFLDCVSIKNSKDFCKKDFVLKVNSISSFVEQIVNPDDIYDLYLKFLA
jgi:hypothetical protein